MRRSFRGTDEKLGLILGQVTGLRRRLNSLALQHGLLGAFAIVIGIGALVYAGAFLLTPLWFLAAASLGALFLIAGVTSFGRTAWRRRANLVKAAELADERGGLRGRLVTIVQTPLATRRSPLWSYLVEDTLGHRAEFIPSAIESHRISRVIFPFLGSLAFALAVVPLANVVHHKTAAIAPAAGDITVDLNDLQLRPAEPGDEPGAEVQADPSTMRQLEAKLAREGFAPGQGSASGVSNMLNQARKFADRMQQKVRGASVQPPLLTLHLADAGPQPNPVEPGSEPWRHGSNEDSAGQFQRDEPAGNGPLPPPDPTSPNLAPEPAGGENPTASNDLNSGQNQGNPTSDQHSADESASGQRSTGGGAMHGIGADPDSLFGAPTPTKLGAEGFEISIDARPMEDGAKGAGHAYSPPRVHAPLSARQQPDEPIARGDIPPDDRDTIKRVFDR